MSVAEKGPYATPRREKRSPANIEIHYGTGPELVRGVSSDISPGGIGVSGEKTYPSGTEVDVEFRVSETAQDVLRVKAMVRWSTWNRLGLQFVDVRPSDHQKIVDLIARLAESQRKAAGSWDILGDAYAQKGDQQSAVTAYKKAIELYPDLPETANKLKKILDRADQP